MKEIRASTRATAPLALALGVALTCVACGPPADESLNPTATYTAFGHPFEPATALPIHALVAEPDSFLNAAVMVEGLARPCAVDGCWMRLPSGDTAEVRILDPEFAVPDTIEGRRIVVHGELSAADTTAGQTATSRTGSEENATTAGAQIFNLNPTGLMVEKVRP